MNSDYSPFIVGIKLSLRLAPCHYFHGHGGFSLSAFDHYLSITRASGRYNRRSEKLTWSGRHGLLGRSILGEN